MNIEKLEAQLLAHEGKVPHAYQDSLGYWTIGVGRLIDKRKGGGLSDDEIALLLHNDIVKKESELDGAIPWWKELDDVRQRVIIEMAFNLGTQGLLKFVNTLGLIRAGRYAEAAERMMVSLWSKQVGGRANKLAEMMRTGKDQ